jgi:hypothetical protein
MGEARDGRPAAVRSTQLKAGAGITRIEFSGAPNAKDQNLEEISWEEFFEKFHEANLALLYQEETAGGERSNFSKLVELETAEAREHGETHASRHARRRDLPARLTAPARTWPFHHAIEVT